MAAFKQCVAIDWATTSTIDPTVHCHVHFASDFEVGKDLLDYAEVHEATTLYQLNTPCLGQSCSSISAYFTSNTHNRFTALLEFA